MKFEDIKKLQQKKFREELGFFLVEGEHLVQELQRRYPDHQLAFDTPGSSPRCAISRIRTRDSPNLRR